MNVSSRKAQNVSIFAFILSLVFFIFTLIFGAYIQVLAVYLLSWQIFAKVMVWLVLLIQFRQRDLAEQEKLEMKELESITKAAVTANDQINTPLGVIIGRATLLSGMVADNDNAQKNLNVIKEQAYRIKETLNEMKKNTEKNGY